MKYAGKNLFGEFMFRIMGPIPKVRNLREALPGVVGYRTYLLSGSGGPDTLVWRASGRHVAVSLKACERFILDGISYVGTGPAVFETISGLKFRNCELVDFRPGGPYTRVVMPTGIQAVAIDVVATIEQMSP